MNDPGRSGQAGCAESGRRSAQPGQRRGRWPRAEEMHCPDTREYQRDCVSVSLGVKHNSWAQAGPPGQGDRMGRAWEDTELAVPQTWTRSTRRWEGFRGCGGGRNPASGPQAPLCGTLPGAQRSPFGGGGGACGKCVGIQGGTAQSDARGLGEVAGETSWKVRSRSS